MRCKAATPVRWRRPWPIGPGAGNHWPLRRCPLCACHCPHGRKLWCVMRRRGARDGSLISIRMDQATQGAVYQSLADALQPFADLQSAIASLAALAAERYVASPNFTVLHMITGMRALRVLSPWIESEEGVQPILIRAFTAAYLAARVVPLAVAPEPHLHMWPEVIAAAIASDDDHVIKLVHACREEAACVWRRKLFARSRLGGGLTRCRHPPQRCAHAGSAHTAGRPFRSHP